MTSTGWLAVAGVCLVLAYCGLVLLLELFASWAENRERERTAAATFERDYIAEAEDVEREQADRDACVALAEVVEMLADVGLVRKP